MAKARDIKHDPLRPRFPRAAILEITQMSGAMAQAQLSKACAHNHIDYALVKAASAVALSHFGVGRPVEMSTTYPVEVAAPVAHLNLDAGTPTKAESVLAALFEQTIARNPNSAGTMRDALIARLSAADELTLERRDAVNAAFVLADQVARFSRVPRLYAGNPNLPPQVFEDAQEMALAMPNPRVAVIKTAEAMNRLRTWERANERSPKEAQNILTIAEKLYQPLAVAVGWKAAADKIQDYIFEYRHPGERKRVVRAVEDQMGEGFYDREKEIVKAGSHFIKSLVEGSLNKDRDNGPVEVDVHGRAKHPASVHNKLQQKGYEIGAMTDLLAFRVVVPGDDRAMCYKALSILQQAFRLRTEHLKDYLIDDTKPYESLHLVATAKDHVNPNIGRLMPGELQGKTIEIQIRTQRMDHEAEVGIASHLGYKSNGVVTAGNRYLDKVVRTAMELHGIEPAINSYGVYGRMTQIPAGTQNGNQSVMPEFMITLPHTDTRKRAAIMGTIVDMFEGNSMQPVADAKLQQQKGVAAIGAFLEAKALPPDLAPPEELRHGRVKINVVGTVPQELDCATEGWNAQKTIPVSPYLQRIEQVRSSLTALNAGKPVKEVAARDIFLVREDGSPLRLPNGAGLMDAAVALDPKNVHARRINHNGVLVDMDSPAAKKERIKNGDTLVVPPGSLETNRPPDADWLKGNAMFYAPSRTVVMSAINGSDKKPGAMRAPRRQRAGDNRPGQS